MARILIIEDDKKIQTILREFLHEDGFDTLTADDGVEGIRLFKENEVSLVLLDIMMPKVDGFAVLEILRQESAVPVIILTALEREEQQMKGFDLYADDYIVKPFSINLVIRRIKAVLRRSAQNKAESSPAILSRGDITLDTDSLELSRGGRAVSVTYKELELIRLFLEHQNKVFTRDELLNAVWGCDYFGDDTVVNNHIMRIRKKLGQNFIATVRGIGYKMGPEDESEA